VWKETDQLIIYETYYLYRTILHIISCVFFFIGAQFSGLAQSGFYVPNQGKIFFTGDTATIFSNVINGGKLGIGKGAFVNFKGRVWENTNDALMPDESNAGEGITGSGGMLRFLSTDTTRQFINGGYNAATRLGPGFANLQIQNSNGVTLTGSTAKVRNELKLTNGLVYLGNNIMVVGNGNPGTISGYDSSRYLVTGNAPGMGLLIRENIRSGDGMVVFPVGSKPHAYTPAAVRTKAAAGDDFYVGVFDSARSLAVSGVNLKEESVNKTWEVGKRFRPNQDEVELWLQHLILDEGTEFRQNRSFAYVSKFNSNGWDTAAPLITPKVGSLTTGPLLLNSGVNNRTLENTLPATSYFTKFTGKADLGLNKTKVWLSAYRINYQNVKVYWTTKPEINNNYFVVQRRFSNQTGYTNIDTVSSKAINGTSLDFLNYTINDPNNYSGITYYRLMLVDYSGRISYSNIVPVGRIPGGNQLLIWPNPSTGRFFVGISTASAVKSIVIWDIVGRKLKEEPVNDRNIIEMYLPIPGTYVVGFVSYSGQLLESQKLLIRGYY
jgi:hypothetical protein